MMKVQRLKILELQDILRQMLAGDALANGSSRMQFRRQSVSAALCQ
jgi:hypothetical protein